MDHSGGTRSGSFARPVTSGRAHGPAPTWIMPAARVRILRVAGDRGTREPAEAGSARIGSRRRRGRSARRCCASSAAPGGARRTRTGRCRRGEPPPRYGRRPRAAAPSAPGEPPGGDRSSPKSGFRAPDRPRFGPREWKIADFPIVFETHSYFDTYVYAERGLHDNPSRRSSTSRVRDSVQLSAIGRSQRPTKAPFLSHIQPYPWPPGHAIQTPGGPKPVPFGLYGDYSSRRATDGRTRAARKAGRVQARRVTARVKVTIASTSVSSTRNGTESMK